MRILVIEDEKKVAGFIKRGLKEEGYSVDAAVDGEQGYFLAGTNDYDVIVLDRMLPKMDGVTVCRKLREERNNVPVIMLTAKDSVDAKIAGLDSGANDYLTKPFAFEELLARIRAVTRKGDGSSTKLRVADLEMDLSTRKVLRAKRAIELSNKEYALLEFLMRHAGAIVTRTMISEQVWEISFDTFTNVIEVYINHLRKKIDYRHKKKLLRTIRGRGYILQN